MSLGSQPLDEIPEDAVHLLTDRLGEQAPVLAERSFERLVDVEQADLGRRSRDRVAAARTALRIEQTDPNELLEHLREVGVGSLRRAMTAIVCSPRAVASDILMRSAMGSILHLTNYGTIIPE